MAFPNVPSAMPLHPPAGLSAAQTTVPVDEAPALVGSAVHIEHPDGSLTIEFGTPEKARSEEDNSNFYRNLADEIDYVALAQIASEVLDGIEADEASRAQWLNDQAEAIEMLGLKLEEPRTDVTGAGGELAGMSTVRHPLLLEATLRFQANARGELLPSDGPVKVSVDSQGDEQSDDLAQELEDGLNHYLTVTASEYYPDTNRMLFGVGYGGCGFKKVFPCPLRRRPVSESVPPADLIVNNTATDLKNAQRVTHVIRMAKSTLKRMQIVGAYRDVELGDETYVTPTPVEEAQAEQQGIAIQTTRPQDQPYDLYECYCELDIPGFEDKDKDGATGLRLPYKVTVHRASRQILEVRRNWRQDDDLKMPREVFVKYPFVEGMGFYGIGLAHILGNSTRALTAAWRIMLDNGMFSNFPGFLFLKGAARQNTNEIRVPPGGGAPVDSDAVDIRQAIMPLPYKDVSQAFMGLTQMVSEAGQRVGGTAELQVGEGKQDAPVGTTLALIEQATKIMDAVHKNIHAAQAKEFQLLKDLIREDPACIWRGRQGLKENWNEEKFVEALNRADISPKADPNTPSQMHRVMKAQALVQLATLIPQKFNIDKVIKDFLRTIGYSKADEYLIPDQPQAPQEPSPTDQAALQIAQARLLDAQTKAQKAQADSQLDAARIIAEQQRAAADIQSREKIATVQALTKVRTSHPPQGGPQ